MKPLPPRGSADGRTGPRRTLADRLVDRWVAAFALWTVVCHGVIFSGGDLHDLLWAVAATAAAGLVFGIWLRRRRSVRAPEPGQILTRSEVAWLAAWAVLAVSATAVLSRADVDDAYYLNMAITTADHPERPLMCCDSLHGRPDLALAPPSSRFRTLEVLTGTLSYLTGIDVIQWHHRVLPPIAALLLVLAWARLYRWLAPGRWLWCLGVTIVTFLTVADTNAWYSNLAFVRLHQGKAVFVSVLVPLILAKGLEMGRNPSRRAWWRLAAVQVAGLGLNATATWLAPTIAILALVAGQRRLDLGGLRAVATGGLTCAYPLAAGLYLRTVMSFVLASSVANKDSYELLANAVSYVLGRGGLMWAAPVMVALAWWASPPGLGRRVAIVFPVGFFLVFFNPWTAHWFASKATGSYVYWRVFWILPLPAYMAMVLTIPLTLRGSIPWAWLRRGITAAVVGAFLFWIPGTWMLSEGNGVTVAPFRLKAGFQREVAEQLVAHVEPGATVLAPVDVAPWVTTFHDHPHPLVVRRQYLRGDLGRGEVLSRWKVARWVSGQEKRPRVFRAFQRSLFKYGVTGVCFRRRIPDYQRTVTFLTVNGYERDFAKWGYEVWTRDTPMTERPKMRRLRHHLEKMRSAERAAEEALESAREDALDAQGVATPETTSQGAPAAGSTAP
ncbi:MAG: DUF6077 domain-containing protein [Acidobacteriota bacterium]